MRPISQIFADNLSNTTLAQSYVQEHGWTNTKAVMWLAMQGHADMSWTEVLRNNPPPKEDALQGFLMLLASRGEWEDKKHLAEALLACVDNDQLLESYAVHCASWAGQTSALVLLEERLPPIDWNALNDEELSPLALALDEMHLNTTVHLRKKGGSLQTTIKGKKSVLSWAQDRHMGAKDAFKKFLAVTDDTYHLQEALQGKGEKKTRKAKKI